MTLATSSVGVCSASRKKEDGSAMKTGTLLPVRQADRQTGRQAGRQGGYRVCNNECVQKHVCIHTYIHTTSWMNVY